MAGEKLSANISARGHFRLMLSRMKGTTDESASAQGNVDLPMAVKVTESGTIIRATNPSDAIVLDQAVTDNPGIEPYTPPKTDESSQS